MSLVNLIVVLVLIGVALWAINTFVPLDPKIRTIINVVIVIAVVLWLLQAFGLLAGLHTARVG